ncbi:ATP-binding protein [Actinoplanes sp. CA-142083]|uniref:ATP-binding protein n=1 Tax=Actinoplanes sp. CA-142083 TaxID=3239903 RepID=UPI003D8AB32C
MSTRTSWARSPRSGRRSGTSYGAGIPDDELPYIFERFFRGRHAETQAVPGMGLGLAIAWRIVTAHGGSLAVTSAGAGCGTHARISLPAG